MSDCEHGRQVSAYHDGELLAQDRFLLEAHLGRCASCARELEKLRGLSRVLADARVLHAPPDVLERLHGTVAAARERVLIGMAEVLTAAAAVIMVVCAAWLWRGSEKTEAAAVTPSAWELAAVGVRDDASTSETQQFAQWMVRELSLEDAND